ncbi:hypothetical protein [Polyangium aurulentum]|uniref:hypothetical protein n=1 Tax=Polyangium aurulentum TaxID=2567896 RepID=UPI00146DD99C|nr:hypothetical protein [Polyangium aurulentum]UQA56125.1 hypothetical protein E8A73_033090 [Polyangium aurulentum]
MVLGIVVSSAALALGCSESEPDSASEAQSAIHQDDSSKSAESPGMASPAIGKGPGPGALVSGGASESGSAQAPTQNGLDDGECVEDPACESGLRCRTCKPTTEPGGGCVEECAPAPEPPLKGCSGSSGSGGSTGSTGGTGGGGGAGGSGGTGGGGTGGEGGDLNGQIN